MLALLLLALLLAAPGMMLTAVSIGFQAGFLGIQVFAAILWAIPLTCWFGLAGVMAALAVLAFLYWLFVTTVLYALSAALHVSTLQEMTPSEPCPAAISHFSFPLEPTQAIRLGCIASCRFAGRAFTEAGRLLGRLPGACDTAVVDYLPMAVLLVLAGFLLIAEGIANVATTVCFAIKASCNGITWCTATVLPPVQTASYHCIVDFGRLYLSLLLGCVDLLRGTITATIATYQFLRWCTIKAFPHVKAAGYKTLVALGTTVILAIACTLTLGAACLHFGIFAMNVTIGVVAVTVCYAARLVHLVARIWNVFFPSSWLDESLSPAVSSVREDTSDALEQVWWYLTEGPTFYGFVLQMTAPVASPPSTTQNFNRDHIKHWDFGRVHHGTPFTVPAEWVGWSSREKSISESKAWNAKQAAAAKAAAPKAAAPPKSGSCNVREAIYKKGQEVVYTKHGKSCRVTIAQTFTCDEEEPYYTFVGSDRQANEASLSAL